MSDSTPPPPSEDPGSNPPPPAQQPPPPPQQPPPPAQQPPPPPQQPGGGYQQPPAAGFPGYTDRGFAGQAPSYGGPPQPGNNSKALWAMILGIVGIVCCGFVAGIPAIILGKQAQNEIDASGGAQGGRGMATAGFVLGIISCVLGVLGVILYATGALTLNLNANG